MSKIGGGVNDSLNLNLNFIILKLYCHEL